MRWTAGVAVATPHGADQLADCVRGGSPGAAREPIPGRSDHGIVEAAGAPGAPTETEIDMTTTVHRPPRPPAAPSAGTATRLLGRVTALLAAHSVAALRISLGLVIIGFGALKYFPGASPAADLAARTVEALTFGVVTGTTAVVATALVETFIGLTLLTGVGLRTGLVAMVGWLGGIMAPVVIFSGEMFPGGLPTLTAQYVLKDVILVAATAVVAAHVLGARYVVREQSR